MFPDEIYLDKRFSVLMEIWPKMALPNIKTANGTDKEVFSEENHLSLIKVLAF